MELEEKKDSLRVRLSNKLEWTVNFFKDVIDHAIESAIGTIKSLWRNAEAVAILTLGGLGISHFIGVVAVEHPTLAMLVIADMISPVIAVFVIWGLIRLAMARKAYRMSHVVP